MTDEQIKHSEGIAEEIKQRINRKYIKGAEEHGTLLWEHPPLEIIDFTIDEIVDLCVYVLTLKQSLLKYSPIDLTVDDMA